MAKICPECATWCAEDAKFCYHCGNSFVLNENATGSCNPEPKDIPHAGTDIGFAEAFFLFWQRYADFSGRSRRREYWFVVLWNIIISTLISHVLGYISYTLEEVVSTCYSLALICPMLAVSVRRLHDVGKSGWNLLLYFIPVVGWIILLIFVSSDSQKYPNRFGESPKYKRYDI